MFTDNKEILGQASDDHSAVATIHAESSPIRLFLTVFDVFDKSILDNLYGLCGVEIYCAFSGKKLTCIGSIREYEIDHLYKNEIRLNMHINMSISEFRNMSTGLIYKNIPTYARFTFIKSNKYDRKILNLHLDLN